MSSSQSQSVASQVMSWYDALTHSVPDATIKGVLVGARDSVSSAVETTTSLTQGAITQVNAAVNAVLLPNCHALSTRPLPLAIVPVLGASIAALWKISLIRCKLAAPDDTANLTSRALPFSRRLQLYHSVQMLVSGAAIGAAVLVSRALPENDADQLSARTALTTFDAVRKIAGLTSAAPVVLQREAISSTLEATRQAMMMCAIPYIAHTVATVYGTRKKNYTTFASRALWLINDGSAVADLSCALFLLNRTGIAPLIKLAAVAQLAGIDAAVQGSRIRRAPGCKAVRGVLSSFGVVSCIAVLSTTRYGVSEFGTVRQIVTSLGFAVLASVNARAQALPTAPLKTQALTIPVLLALNVISSAWTLSWSSQGMCPNVQFGARQLPTAKLFAAVNLGAIATALAVMFFNRTLPTLITAPTVSAAPQPPPEHEAWSKEFVFAESS